MQKSDDCTTRHRTIWENGKKLFSEDIDCLNYTDFEQKSFENFIKLV
jgi:hypothetical protein